MMKKVTTIYAVYMITLIMCSFTTYICMVVDVCLHWDDLGRAMTSMLVLILIMNKMWILLYYS